MLSALPISHGGTDGGCGVCESALWFALRVLANHERAVSLRLGRLGVASYSPEYAERVRWSDRTKTTRRPLFPGYLFAQICDQAEYAAAVSAAGVVGALPSNTQPAAISDQEMDTIRRIETCGLEVRPYDGHAVGDVVQVSGGPLDGISGVIVRLARAPRLVVRIQNFLGRAIAIELDAHSLSSANYY
jgi:transcription antitermination factor NusG